MVGAVGAVREITPEVIGTTTGKESWEYSWRDSAIYAVGVGAKEDEIEYQYEAGIKAIPTYAMVPVWGTFGITPHRDLPDNVSFRLGLDRQNSLDMAHKLILHKPIDATGGSFTIEDVVTDVFDRRGKGAVVRTTMTGRDASGEKVFTNIADNYFGVCSAPGFADFPKSEVLFPDREPDHAVRETLGANQNLLYRLAGDTNRVHVDVDEARAQGFDRPIMQGFRDTRGQLAELLSAPTIDKDAVEKLRAERVAAVDEASRKLTDALVNAAETLTPEQRAKLAERMKERHGRW